MRRCSLAVLALSAPPPPSPRIIPNRPVRIIVPTPAGGPVDVMARLLANALPATLGQNVFIENKPGAGNTLGSRLAAAADPDGYTLMVSAASGLIMSPMIHKNAGYDARQLRAGRADRGDAASAGDQSAAAVQIGRRARRLRQGQSRQAQLFDRRRRHAAASRPPNCSRSSAGTDIVHVPYKGGGPALTAVVAGEAQIDLRHLGHLAAIDPRRQIARAGDRRPPSACAESARRADHAPRSAFPAVTERRLDRADGAQGTPPDDRRQAQRRRQCRAQVRAHEKRRSPNSARSRAAARRKISPPISRASAPNGRRLSRR